VLHFASDRPHLATPADKRHVTLSMKAMKGIGGASSARSYPELVKVRANQRRQWREEG
jgi:hypothetical protein